MRARFVVQEHHATRLHFDFRLEIDGVLKSWAIPKGPSMNPADKRLAVEVAEHPLEYIDFEGIIPAGNYGAGAVVIWDEGEFDLLERTEKKISFVMHGRRLQGGFTLSKIRFRGKGPSKDWLLIKKRDEQVAEDWRLELALTAEKKAQLEERAPICET
ncbi:MAG: 3'-phosphoesterase [Deltaproteobacteria bacterium]|nr:MAG: 3'-phosphoesterase [Deltaproteobacteria bacterium]